MGLLVSNLIYLLGTLPSAKRAVHIALVTESGIQWVLGDACWVIQGDQAGMEGAEWCRGGGRRQSPPSTWLPSRSCQRCSELENLCEEGIDVPLTHTWAHLSCQGSGDPV